MVTASFWQHGHTSASGAGNAEDPDLVGFPEELIEATKRLGYNPEAVEASYPKRFPIRSAYISIEKKKSKSTSTKEIATMLSVVRGEIRSEEKSGG